ncbi:MAG: endonuclease/exonuclease/phosphatase family protein [Treponematales bacterium]
MKRFLVWGILAVLSGCAAAGNDAGDFRAVVWNVQTLFDGEKTGFEYADFRGKAGWTEAKYSARLNAIADGIMRIGPEVPDLVGLIEVENLKVLEDLAVGSLAKHRYKWAGFAGAPGSALGVGVLSRHPLSEVKAHSLTSGKETLPRPVLEVRVETPGTAMVFFVCHWKSKTGGDAATEPLRRAAARVINRRLAEIQTEAPEMPVIIMGDLNENHDEFYRRGKKAVTALLPDTHEAAELAASEKSAADFLVITGEKPPEAANFNVPALYSPWGSEMQNGSYYYRGAWETLDHFLLAPSLFDRKGWEFASCGIAGETPFVGAKGTPDRYNPRNGLGLSDHLPLFLLLKNETP